MSIEPTVYDNTPGEMQKRIFIGELYEIKVKQDDDSIYTSGGIWEAVNIHRHILDAGLFVVTFEYKWDVANVGTTQNIASEDLIFYQNGTVANDNMLIYYVEAVEDFNHNAPVPFRL